MKLFLVITMSSFATFGLICFIFFSNNSFSTMGTIHFRNRNGDFTFTAMPSKGRDFMMMERQFKTFLKQSNSGDTTLYRVTSKNYFRISKWCMYKGMPEWNYPYLWKQ